MATHANATRPIAPRFSDYAAFKAYVWDEYIPLPQEVDDPAGGFVAGSNWAKRAAPRLFRAAKAIEGSLHEGASVLDIGAYPGSFVRLLRAAYPGDYAVAACGMPVHGDFLEAMARDQIEFRACNLDPDLISDGDLPVGLPYESGSIDVITCMEVVEHLYSLRTVLTECRRVLAPDGIVYITTDNILNREGIVRLLRSGETNLDVDLDQTSIWSDHHNQWRGHVRFYSTGQLADAARRAGLETVRAGYFSHYADPDVFAWPDRGALGKLRAWLRGHGDRPPINLGAMARSLRHIGPRALGRRFDDHIEMVLKKP